MPPTYSPERKSAPTRAVRRESGSGRESGPTTERRGSRVEKWTQNWDTEATVGFRQRRVAESWGCVGVGESGLHSRRPSSDEFCDQTGCGQRAGCVCLVHRVEWLGEVDNHKGVDPDD